MAEPSRLLRELCQTLNLPTVAREALPLAEAARRQGVAPMTSPLKVPLCPTPTFGNELCR